MKDAGSVPLDNASLAAFNTSFTDIYKQWLASLTETGSRHFGVLSYFQSIKPYIVKHKVLLSAMILALSVQVAYSLLLPFAYQFITDTVIINKDLTLLVIALSVVGCAFLLRIGAGSIGEYYKGRLGVSVGQDIRVNLYKHLQTLSPLFYQQRGVAELNSRLTGDCQTIEQGVTDFIPNSIQHTAIGILSLSLLFYIEWHLALLTLLALPIILFASKPFAKKAATLAHQRKDQSNILTATIQEDLNTHLVRKGK